MQIFFYVTLYEIHRKCSISDLSKYIYSLAIAKATLSFTWREGKSVRSHSQSQLTITTRNSLFCCNLFNKMPKTYFSAKSAQKYLSAIS